MPKPTSTTVSFSFMGLSFTGTAVVDPGDPGRVSGPPEKCYPPEDPSIAFDTLTCEGKDAMFLLDSSLSEDIEGAALDAFAADQEPDYGPEDL